MDNNKVVTFAVGCRRCAHLDRIGKNTYVCAKRVHMDDTAIIPIKDGVKTSDWGICAGKSYQKVQHNYRMIVR